MDKLGIQQILTDATTLENEEQNKLLYKYFETKDPNIKTILLQSNLRLVASVIKKFRLSSYGVSTDDLFQAGVIGLNRAIEKFNPKEFENEFSTYAFYWIKQRMYGEIANAKFSVRIPTSVMSQLGVINRTKSSLEIQLSREPTEEEIFKESGLTKSVFESTMKFRGDLFNMSKLDQIATEGKSETLGDFIIGKTPDFNESIRHKSQELFLEKIFDRAGLSDREIKVLTVRFGLNGGVRKTLEETGKTFGVVRERIRQIENKCLEKIHFACSSLGIDRNGINDYILK